MPGPPLLFLLIRLFHHPGGKNRYERGREYVRGNHGEAHRKRKRNKQLSPDSDHEKRRNKDGKNAKHGEQARNRSFPAGLNNGFARDIPDLRASSRIEWMFSISTVASSTRTPTARARPPSDMMLIVCPAAHSQTTGESSANGIVVITMRELRQSLKNRSTIPPSEAPSAPSVMRLRIAFTTNLDWSNSRRMSTSSGATPFIRGRAFLTRLMTSSVEASALAGTAVETLDSIGAIYGPGPGQLAESNPSEKLAPGKIIPITGIVRQLQQSDLTDPAKTLANLAADYSVGAQTPITAENIQDFNPGVTVALGGVYYIPAINYVVSTSPGPGDTFASISAYYGLSMDAAAVDAREVGGIFPANTTLDIATQLLDLRPTLGPGKIGILLEPKNFGVPCKLPPNPTQEEKAVYAQAYMYSLYNTLSAGFLENVYFPSSPLGLPFGPQDQTDRTPIGAFASHAKAAEQRRSRLLAVALDDFDYRQTLGFGKFSEINAAPDPQSAGLPTKSANPYIGVGGTAEIALRWQDIFGNITITPFELAPPGYKGAINGCAATILYQDLLKGIGLGPTLKPATLIRLRETRLNST
jgi:hypothetical protein